MTGDWKPASGATCENAGVDLSLLVDTRESCSYCRRWLVVDAWDGTPDGRVAAGRAAGWNVWAGRLYGVSMMPQFTCPECVAAESSPNWQPMTMDLRRELQGAANAAGVEMIRNGLRAHESRYECLTAIGLHGVGCTCAEGPA